MAVTGQAAQATPAGRAEDRYPAAPLQQGLLFNSLREPGGGVDVIQVVWDWPEPLDEGAFATAWRRACARHAVLRTCFAWEAGAPEQVVHRGATAPPAWLDRPADGPEARRELLEAFLHADRARGFALDRAPLLRVTVLRTAGGGHTAVVTFHHAVLDGRSLVMLLGEVLEDYRAARAGVPPPDRPDPPPYRDFAAAAVRPPAGAEAFWRGRLRGVAPATPVSVEPDGEAAIAAVEAVLPEATGAALRALAERHHVTLATLVEGAWAVLLHRYGGGRDACFAVTRSCRRGSVDGAEAMVGLLINTLPLRLPVDPAQPLAAYLAEVRRRELELRAQQLAPLPLVRRWSGLPGDAPLATSLVVVERQALQSALRALDPAWAGHRVELRRRPSYPLTLYAFDEPRPRLLVLADRRHLGAAAAGRLLGHARTLLEGMTAEPPPRVGDLPLLDRAERALLVRAWNATRSPYPEQATVPALFAARARAAPAATALVAGGRRLSYGQLDEAANRLAWWLRDRGVRADEPVAVALPRGTDLVVALLAVLKAGGAYVPLDPADPPARAALVLADCGARLLLTVPGGPVPPPGVAAARLEELAPALAGLPATAPRCPATPASLAYVSYTSGSTGTPKGVAVPHRAVVRLVHRPSFARLGPSETLLQLAPVAFDASTLELWGSLLNGARLVLAPPGPLDLDELGALLRRERVSTLWLTAGLFHQLVERDPGALAGVRQLLAGGDVLDPAAVRAALAARGGRPLVNGYGPTENTTFTCCHAVTDRDAAGERAPIGRPIQRTTAYVLDGRLRPLPVGVAGELYTGGDGLARGYLARPGLTAERFLPDPFAGVPGARLYRTGDLARWRSDGVLEFLGRADRQVKVRGFRVEPGEVEAVLRRHPGVGDAVVVARGEGDARRLDAYLTGAEPPGMADLRAHVAAHLPEALRPASYTVLARLPLNANGKVDRAALPEAATPAVATGRPPATATERELARLWAGLLGAAPGSADDDFFDLGGNSLLVTRLVFRVREALGVEVTIGDVYAAPTVAGCAAAVERRRRERAPAVIGRRDRAAARAPAAPPEHLVELEPGRWALWRWAGLRGAGFGVGRLLALASPGCAAAADRLLDAPEDPAAARRYQDAFATAVRDLSAALHGTATDPRFRQAVAWQNPHALRTGVDVLVRRGPAPPARPTKHRQHEALVASYLQRYCAKNDTVGFFGPVGWARLGEAGAGVAVRPGPGLVAERAVHLEGWCVAALAEALAREPGMRPWLVPRRLPFVTVEDGWLHLPLTAPQRLPDAKARVLEACDGRRTTEQLTRDLLVDPTEVELLLAELHAERRIKWGLEVPVEDLFPERALRRLLERVGDARLRARSLAALGQLEAARDAVAAAGDDSDRLVAALGELESTFSRLTGRAPSRRPGQQYAGRTLAYEDCRRDAGVGVGADLLAGLREPLSLVLDSARWFTFAGASLFQRACLDLYREHARPGAAMPLADLWLWGNELLFDLPERLVEPVVRALQERWARLLEPPAGARRVRRGAAGLRERARAAFATPRPGWLQALHHSPDLLLVPPGAGSGARWVLGELHPGVNSLRSALFVSNHPAPGELRAAMRADLPRPQVVLAATFEEGGLPPRLHAALLGPEDLRLQSAHDSTDAGAVGAARAGLLPVGDCLLEPDGDRLMVRTRDGRCGWPLMDVLGELLMVQLVQRFQVMPARGHTPRVELDSLVLARESWTFAAGEMPLATEKDEAGRFLRARAWRREHGLPRFVFVRISAERKPFLVDFDSLVSVDLLARAVRRAARTGPGAAVRLTEMLPGPGELWLHDAAGERYTAELRMIAVDLRAAGHGEGGR